MISINYLKYVLIYFLSFNLLTFKIYGQAKKQIDIQHILLKDTFLRKEVEKLIAEQVNSNDPQHSFKHGLGYITVNVSKHSKGDTLLEYYIAPNLYSIKEEDLNQIYPPFYTYIGNRIALIYLSELDFVAKVAYSEKSKRMLRKKIKPFLEKTKDVTFYDVEGRKMFRDKKMRIDYFQFHNGKYIYILKDKPPIVVKGRL